MSNKSFCNRWAVSEIENCRIGAHNIEARFAKRWLYVYKLNWLAE